MAATNTYGIVRPPLITAEDVDIFYNYRPTRNTDDARYAYFIQHPNPSEIFSNGQMEVPVSGTTDLRLPGMYSLKLPVSIFGRIGFYTVFIRPRELYCKIQDVGVLSAYSDIRGIVVDTNTLTNGRSLFMDDGLTGYRVEYYNYEDGGLKRQQYYRIVTSSNLCEPVSQNLTSANTNNNGYRFSNSGSLSFLTVTPSTSPSFRPNAIPYIGVPNQTIALINTKFDPVCLEINIVEHDIETVSTMLEGDVIRNLENGRITHYNKNGEIYLQQEMFTIKNNYTTTNIAEVRHNVNDNIDNSLDYNEIING